MIYNIIVIATGRPSARKICETNDAFSLLLLLLLLLLRLPTIIGWINILLHIILIDRLNIFLKELLYLIRKTFILNTLRTR